MVPYSLHRGLHPTGAPRGASRSGSTTTMDILNEHRRTSFKYDKVQLGPPALRGLMEVDLCTSLPSGVPEPGRLPCSVTRLQLLGVQDSAVHRWDPQRIRMRGQAGRPAWSRPAPPAALPAPRRRLARRPAGDDAPVGDDATGAVERRRAAVIRPAGLPPSTP